MWFQPGFEIATNSVVECNRSVTDRPVDSVWVRR
jgi:hypothetical protein